MILCISLDLERFICAFQFIHEHVSVEWTEYLSELKQILSGTGAKASIQYDYKFLDANMHC